MIFPTCAWNGLNFNIVYPVMLSGTTGHRAVGSMSQRLRSAQANHNSCLCLNTADEAWIDKADSRLAVVKFSPEHPHRNILY
jgi:hypothetical protein